MKKKFPAKRLIIWPLFIFFVFTSTVNAIGMPLLLSILDDHHNAYLSYEHGEVHVVLKHHQDHFVHDHAVLDSLYVNSAIGHDHGSDHDNHFFEFEEAASAVKRANFFKSNHSINTICLSHDFTSLRVTRPVFCQKPGVNPSLVSLSTVFLLI